MPDLPAPDPERKPVAGLGGGVVLLCHALLHGRGPFRLRSTHIRDLRWGWGFCCRRARGAPRKVSSFKDVMQVRSLSGEGVVSDGQSLSPGLCLGHQERGWTWAKMYLLKLCPSKGRAAKNLFTGYAQGPLWTAGPGKLVRSLPLPSCLPSDALRGHQCFDCSRSPHAPHPRL